jgi:formamidopyrimidine-DNA glycosylase
MPEVSEVKKITTQLNAEFGGHKLANISVVGGRFVKDNTGALLDGLNWPLTNVRMCCKGKFLYWQAFDSNNADVDFHITLGMTGSFGKKQKHSALQFDFDNGSIYFNDPRHFGTFKISSRMDTFRKLNTLGWDALEWPHIPEGFIVKLQKARGHKTIAEVMLDQRWFAGCGNYLRAETLYAAKIKPDTLVSQLTHTQLTTLCKFLIKIVREAYDAGGATIATYSDLYGNVGTFYDQFKVYGQKQDPLGNPVIRSQAKDGRTIHWVKEVQV